MKKAFIFDMDGTIFDSERIYYSSWLIMAERYGFNFDLNTKNKLSGLTHENSINLMKELFNIDDKKALEIRKEMDQLRNKMIDEFPKSLKKPGLINLLNYLKSKNKKIALASSSPRTRVDMLLEKENIKDYFDVIIAGDGIKNGKPDPEIFLKAIDLLKVDIKDACVIEDSQAGIKASKNANIQAILIPDLDDREELEKDCDLKFEDLDEFLKHVQQEDENYEEDISDLEKTRPMTFGITCPNCDHEFEYDLDTAIFADSSTKNKMLDNKFGQIICPNCNHDFILNYRYVYTDNKKKYMIVNDPNFSEKKNQLAFKSSLRLLDRLRKDEIDGFKIRMCKDSKFTGEKIAIFDNNKDDKAVELTKLLLRESDSFDLKKENILEIFYQKNNTFLIKTDLRTFKMDFVEEIYKMIIEKYGMYFEESIAETINQEWAKNFMKEVL